jgi:hypothetical protein
LIQNNPPEETVERVLTSEELRELFGKDEKGNALPDAQLNTILRPPYADIFIEKGAEKQPTAQKAVESRTSSAEAHKTKKKANGAAETSKKNVQKAKPAAPATKTNAQKASDASQDATHSIIDPKPDTQAQSKPPKPKAVWNSALALCQQIEVYEGVRVNEYCGYSSIQHVVSEIELEDETVQLRVLRYADGWLEIIVAGLLGDERAKLGKKMHDVKRTSVLELSRRVEFRDDVVIGEYADDDALDAIGAASAEFDRERIMAVLFRHPDGLVEYVVSGLVLQAEATAQAGSAEVDAGVLRPYDSTSGDFNSTNDDSGHGQKQESLSNPTAGDGHQMLVNENDKPVLNSKSPSVTSNYVPTPGPKTGKRKRASRGEADSPFEHSAPSTKKARNDEAANGESTAVKSLIVVLKIPSQKLTFTSASNLAAAMGGEQTGNAANGEVSNMGILLRLRSLEKTRVVRARVLGESIRLPFLAHETQVLLQRLLPNQRLQPGPSGREASRVKTCKMMPRLWAANLSQIRMD